jgi:hypothetical protein
MPDIPDLRNMKMTTSSGKNVDDTQMLKGLAKDSLSGSNTTVQYTTSQDISKEGPMGGEAHFKK